MYSTTHSYPGGVYQILPLTKGKEFHRQFKYVFLPIVLWYHSNLKLKVRFRIYRDKLLDEAIQHKVIEWKRNGCTFVDLDGAKAINVVLNLRIFIKGQTGLMWYRKYGLSDSNVVEGVHFPDFETVGDDKSFPANGVPLWLPGLRLNLPNCPALWRDGSVAQAVKVNFDKASNTYSKCTTVDPPIHNKPTRYRAALMNNNRRVAFKADSSATENYVGT